MGIVFGVTRVIEDGVIYGVVIGMLTGLLVYFILKLVLGGWQDE